MKICGDVIISESMSINELSTLQLDLDDIHTYAEQNDMILNGMKCKEMTICFLLNQPNVLRLCIDGIPLDLVIKITIIWVEY